MPKFHYDFDNSQSMLSVQNLAASLDFSVDSTEVKSPKLKKAYKLAASHRFAASTEVNSEISNNALTRQPSNLDSIEVEQDKTAWER